VCVLWPGRVMPLVVLVGFRSYDSQLLGSESSAFVVLCERGQL
jgi:hypothetical protein